MKSALIFALLPIFLVPYSCSPKTYPSNGETIYKTGKNLQGEKLLDKTASRIKIAGNCQSCHGKNGDGKNGISIRFSSLSNPPNGRVPYDDSKFFRILDYNVKSDGTKANMGVIWKISDQDKKDLLAYLKSL